MYIAIKNIIGILSPYVSDNCTYDIGFNDPAYVYTGCSVYDVIRNTEPQAEKTSDHDANYCTVATSSFTNTHHNRATGVYSELAEQSTQICRAEVSLFWRSMHACQPTQC